MDNHILIVFLYHPKMVSFCTEPASTASNSFDTANVHYQRHVWNINNRDTHIGCLCCYYVIRCPIGVGYTLVVIAGLSGYLLLAECSGNVNGAGNGAADHRVVSDSEEAHHLYECWN